MLLSVHYKSFALALALVLLAGGPCAAAAPPDLEEVLAVEPTTEGIAVTVPTGGCTEKSDFEVSSSPIQNGQASIEFRRLYRDTCKGFFPEGLKLQFTWADLKLPEGTKLTVKNPIEPPLAAPVQVKPKKQIKPISPHHRGRPGHKRPHRHRGHHAKAHVRTHRHASIHSRGRGVQFCYEFPHSRQCPHHKHARVHHRHHGTHCR